MDKNNRFKSTHRSTISKSQDNNLRNHNEKRKAQDSINKELKDSQEFSIFK